MATAQFSTLPRELRDEIWILALLPDPGVYQFDPAWFRRSKERHGFEDERWMIPKRKYPTVMHLCQESRHVSLRIMAQEQRQEQEDGTLPYYCIGSSARPFNPSTDTFWFRVKSHLGHPWVRNLMNVIGGRIHTIKNLALSLECITIDRGSPKPSRWNTFRWTRLSRFVSLRRVDIVFEEAGFDHDSEFGNNGSHSRAKKMANFRCEEWTKGPLSTWTLANVEDMVNKVRASVVVVFQDVVDRIQEDGGADLLRLPAGAPDWHDGSAITFHAARIVKTKA